MNIPPVALLTMSFKERISFNKKFLRPLSCNSTYKDDTIMFRCLDLTLHGVSLRQSSHSLHAKLRQVCKAVQKAGLGTSVYFERR